MADKTTTEFPEELEQAIRSQLRRQLQSGITEGAYAVCKTVRDLAADAGISAEDKIGNIIRFCDVALKGYDNIQGGSKGS